MADIGRLPPPKLEARKPEVERDSRFAPAAAAAICLALAGYVYWYFENAQTRFETASETLARVDAPNFVETGATPVAAEQPYRPFPNARAPMSRPAPTGGYIAAAPAQPQAQPLPSVAAPAPSSPVAAEPRVQPRPAPIPAVAATAPVGPPAELPPVQELAANLPAPRLVAPAAHARSMPAPGAALASTPPLIERISPSHAAAATAPPAPGAVTLHALADTWIEIKAQNTGKVLFSRVLRQGENLPAPDRHGLTMTVGNAGGLEIRVDGQVAPSLGDHGKVVRDVSLEASSLLVRAN